MKIGIIGGGVVGKATARAFMEFADGVRVYDVLPERATHGMDETLACNIVFVCLPTPQVSGGLACDTRILDDFFWKVVKTDFRNANLVIRSTVPVGYTRNAQDRFDLPNLCHSPEFLTARIAVTDAHVPARNIVGDPSGGNGCARALVDLYEWRFPGTPCLWMTSDESEAVKLILNSFFACKIAFFNEAYAFAEKAGLDWERILGGVMADGRIAHAHNLVPGPDGKRGFGGACLPKDTANFAACQLALNLAPVMLQAALLRNDVDRGS